MVYKILLITMLMTAQTWAQGLQLPNDVVCQNGEYPKGFGSKLTIVNRRPKLEVNLYLQVLTSEILHNANYAAFGQQPAGITQLDFSWNAGMTASDYLGEQFSYAVILNWFPYFRTRTVILGVKTHQFDEMGHAQDLTTYYQYHCN